MKGSQRVTAGGEEAWKRAVGGGNSTSKDAEAGMAGLTFGDQKDKPCSPCRCPTPPPPTHREPVLGVLSQAAVTVGLQAPLRAAGSPPGDQG